MNWYVLYVQARKTKKLIERLNRKKNIEAFEMNYEYYRRSHRCNEIKPIFKGYVFIKTKLDQNEFNNVLAKMNEEKDGLIRQLIKHDTSALRKEEIDMFNKLLDESYVIRMSQAFIEDKKAIVYQGPLMYFQDNIIKLDKHDRIAFLNLSFMGRNIKAGLTLTGKK